MTVYIIMELDQNTGKLKFISKFYSMEEAKLNLYYDQIIIEGIEK